jgi:hypothetical protein
MILSFPSSRFTKALGIPLAVLLAACGNLSAQEAEDIRPPKAFVRIPEPEKTPVAWYAGIVSAIVLGIIVWWLWRRFLRKRAGKTPHEIALAALTAIESQRDDCTAEAFANRAAQTVREYIAARFGLAAPKRTTEEFLRDLEKSPLVGEGDHLKTFLKSCDLAKFAGARLDEEKRGELIQAARSFVRATANPGPKPS